MLEYIYDFLSVFLDNLKEKDKIKNIVLFGSFARGNPRNDSDIDLFIDIKEEYKKETDEKVRKALNEFELKAEKTWRIKGIVNSIVPIVDDLDKEQWIELKQDISSYGKILYGAYSDGKKASKRKVLLTYDLVKLKQKDKMAVIRKLFGYKLRKGKKVYENFGLLTSFKGEKLSNAVLIDLENYKAIAEIFRKKKVPLKIREIWTE